MPCIQCDPVRAGEVIALLLLLGGLLIVNLLTAERTPAVWMDEVMYSDPAINLYQGQGFTSGAWYVQPLGKFWAGNVPLYPLLLYGWLKLFGFSLLTVRSLQFVLFSLSVATLWLAIVRLGVMRNSQLRLGFCAVVCLSSPAYFVFRNSRPESLSMLLVALALLAATLQGKTIRLAALFILGALMTWSGLQLPAYVAIAGGLAWFMADGRVRREFLVTGLGCGAGLALLALVYLGHGVWSDFLESIRQHTLATRHLNVLVNDYGTTASKLRRLPGLFLDYSLLPMLALAALLAIRRLTKNPPRTWTWNPLAFGLAAGILVPLALFAIGEYPIYYMWMNFIPLTVGVFFALSVDSSCPKGWGLRFMVWILLMIACLGGLPRRLAAAAAEWPGRNYEPVMKMAAPYAGTQGTIYCDYSAYYAAKQRSAQVILPTCLVKLTPEAKRSVTLAIVRMGRTPQQIQTELAQQFGGRWQATDAFWEPAPGSGILAGREQLGAQNYRLRVFTRVE